MKARSVTFGADMVVAILDNRKSHTRRTSRIPQDAFAVDYDPTRKKWAFHLEGKGLARFDDVKPAYRQCPYGVVGDQLWVKEPWSVPGGCDGLKPSELVSTTPVFYHATDDFVGSGKIRQARFMPQQFSRILLEVTSVSCGRLSDMTDLDAINEGVARQHLKGRNPRLANKKWRDYSGNAPLGFSSPRYSFASLWDSINGQKLDLAWNANPWVWDIGFQVLEVRK